MGIKDSLCKFQEPPMLCRYKPAGCGAMRSTLLLCSNHIVTLFYSKLQQTSLWFERSEVLLTITVSAPKVTGIVISLCDIVWLFTYVYLQYPRFSLSRKGWK